MRMTVIASPRAPHQVAHQAAMVEGLRRHGVEAIPTHSERTATEFAACWGWRMGKRLHDRGVQVLVMERGYIGDRFHWTSLAWNGLNGRGAAPIVDDAGARFRQHHEALLKPANTSGCYVLIVGQVPGDAALQGRCLLPWYAEQAIRAAEQYRMPVKFRPHPLAYKHGPAPVVPGAEMVAGDLDSALAGAAHVITYNSNAGVDALLAGKSVSAADEGSMIWGVTDREAFLHRLAWRQWSLDEIRSGAVWEVLSRG